jgi:hypothetical protein
VWEEREKMKFFLSPPTFWGVFLGKIENFSQKNTPCYAVTFLARKFPQIGLVNLRKSVKSTGENKYRSNLLGYFVNGS